MSNVNLLTVFVVSLVTVCDTGFVDFWTSVDGLEARFLKLPETPKFYNCTDRQQHLFETYKRSLERTGFWLRLPFPQPLRVLFLAHRVPQLEHHLETIQESNRRTRQLIRRKIKSILSERSGPIFIDQLFGNLSLPLYSIEQLVSAADLLTCLRLRLFTKQPTIDSLQYLTLKLAPGHVSNGYFAGILQFLRQQTCTIDAIAERLNRDFDLESNCPPLARTEVLNGPITFAEFIDAVEINCSDSNTKKRLRQCLRIIRRLRNWIRTDLLPNRIRNNYITAIRQIIEPNGYACHLNATATAALNHPFANCTPTVLNHNDFNNFKSARQLAITGHLIRQARQCVAAFGHRTTTPLTLNSFGKQFAQKSEIFMRPIAALIKQPWPARKPNVFVTCYPDDDQRIVQNISTIVHRLDLINRIVNSTNLIDFIQI